MSGQFLFVYKYSQIFGGFNDLINKFGDGMLAHGDQVTILSDSPGYKGRGIVHERGFRVIAFGLAGFWHTLRTSYKGVVLCEPFGSYLLFGMLYKFFHPKSVLSIYCCGSKTEERAWWEEVLLRIGKKWFIDHFIACTYYSANKILFKDSSQAKIVYCPVDVNQYKLTTGLDQKIILSIDRLRSRKNQLALIEAFRIVHEKDPEAELHLVGSHTKLDDPTTLKDYAKKVVAKIHAYGLDRVVYLHGEVDDEKKIEWLSRATVFVKTSHNEMQGIIATEAVASGVPVVAFDNSGTHEVVRDAGGILVKDGDVKAFAEALVRAINDKPLLRSISKQTLASAEKYSLENTLDPFYDIVSSHEIEDL